MIIFLTLAVLQRQQLRDDIPYRNVFENTKAKIFVITANEEVRNYRFVHDVILFLMRLFFKPILLSIKSLWISSLVNIDSILNLQQSLTNNNNLRMKLTKELLVMRNLSLAVLLSFIF